MNRNNRIEIANKTLEIIEKGYYIFNDKKVEVKELIIESNKKTETIEPNSIDLSSKIELKNSYQTIIEVYNSSSIEAIVKESNGDKIAILNFASAKNPGGGFLSGAQSQEESLARSSSLNDSLTKDMTMYQYNRSKTNLLYSDYMIYSPKVAFWYDDEGNPFENPFKADVITSPAPNRGAMIQNNCEDELNLIKEAFARRIEMICRLALNHEIETLILGAWGCGVFRNNSEEVAKYFKEIISTKFSTAFKKIVFAVYSTSENNNILNDFKKEFI